MTAEELAALIVARLDALLALIDEALVDVEEVELPSCATPVTDVQ